MLVTIKNLLLQLNLNSAMFLGQDCADVHAFYFYYSHFYYFHVIMKCVLPVPFIYIIPFSFFFLV